MDHRQVRETETELLQRFVEDNDNAALAHLISRHQNMVLGVAKRILSSADDADDATQACFIRFAQKAKTLHAPVGGWLHHVATHVSLDVFRQNQARKRREKNAIWVKREEGEQVRWEHILGALDSCIAGLPDDLRIPLVMSYLEKQTQVDIAAELGISQPAVSKRIAKALRKLKGDLGKVGITVGVGALTLFLSENTAAAASSSLATSLSKIAVSASKTEAATKVLTQVAEKTARIITSSLVRKVALTTIIAVTMGATSIGVRLAMEKTNGGGIVEPEPAIEVAAASVLETVISGRVIDPHDQPISGASIVVRRFKRGWIGDHTSGWPGRVIGETITDEYGRYELTVGVPERNPISTIYATYKAEGFARHDEKLAGPSLMPPILTLSDTKLGRGIDVKGKIVDHTGRPVSDALILVGPSRSPYHPEVPGTGDRVIGVDVDIDGRFWLENMNPESFLRLILLRKNDKLRLGDWRVPISENIDLKLPELGVIAGRVLDVSGDPVAGAVVECQPSRRLKLGWAVLNLKTNEGGEFRAEGLFPSEYTVSVRGSECSGSKEKVRVRPGETVSCEVRVGKAFDMHGQVVFRETRRLVPDVRVAVMATGRNAAIRSVMAENLNGTFVLRGIPAGDYIRFSVCEERILLGGVARGAELGVGLSSMQEGVDVELLGGGFDTRLEVVVSESSGDPASGAFVRIPGMPALFGTAGLNGRYSLKLLCVRPEPGKPVPILAIAADGSRYGIGEVSSDWRTGEESEIILDRPLKVMRGRVEDESGNPIAGAVINAANIPKAEGLGVALMQACAVSSNDGTFELKSMDPTEQYRIEISADGYYRSAEVIDLITAKARNPFKLVMHPTTAVLVGRVHDENDQPLAGISVSCDRREEPGRTTVTSDEDGLFRFSDLVFGESVFLYARSVDYGPVTYDGVKVGKNPVDIRVEQRQ